MQNGKLSVTIIRVCLLRVLHNHYAFNKILLSVTFSSRVDNVKENR